MLPPIKKQGIRQRKLQAIDDLFLEQDRSLSQQRVGSKFEYRLDVVESLIPISIDKIYKEKKQQGKLLDLNASQGSRSPRASDGRKSRESSVDGSPKSRSPAASSSFRNTSQDTKQKKQNKKNALASKYSFEIDNIDEYFEQLYQKRQEQLEAEEEQKALEEMSPNEQNAITEEWARINVSLKQSQRTLSQDVSQTMNIINSDIKLIVNLQEKNKNIRSLTSVESVFKKAKQECIDVKGIDLMPIGEEGDKLKENTPKQGEESATTKNQQLLLNNSASGLWRTSSDTRLPTLSLHMKPSQYSFEKQQNGMKFKRINNNGGSSTSLSKDNQFNIMHSRFVMKNESPNFDNTTSHQKKSIIRPKLILNNRPSLPSIKYEPLNSFLSDNNISYSINASTGVTPANLLAKVRDTQNFREQKQHGQSTDSMFKFLNNSNSAIDWRSKGSTTIENSYQEQHGNYDMLNSIMNDSIKSFKSQKQLQSQSLSKSTRRISPKKLNATSPSISSTINHPRIKEEPLPQYLEPFKDLVLNTWRGKVRPSKEESILLSNCLGMLSLHTNMSEGIHNIKEYEFKNSRYSAVPSQSTRKQYQTDKKFNKAAAVNPDLKQALMNKNIQQLEQIIELEDPADYLVQDYY